MIKTKIKLVNEEQIEEILKGIVQISYHEVKEDGHFLCTECGDVDLFIAASHHDELQDAINRNFQLDEFGDAIDQEKYHLLMDDLAEYFTTLHLESGYFDYFPAGTYEIKGEKRQSEVDMLAPKGKYFAPFLDALK